MSPLTPLEQQQLHVTPSPTFWHRVRFEVVEAHVRALGASGVIDVGAGSGLLGEHFRGSGVGYRFAESSPALAAALRERLGAGAEDDGGPIAADTVVTLLDVLEHVEDDGALLRSLAERMEAGTGLVITVPAMSWLFSSWDADLGHFRRYGRDDLAGLVARSGFEVTEASYLFPELVPPAAVRKWRRSSGEPAEFPVLPLRVDRGAAAVSRASARLRRWWPVGTSLLVVARRTAEAPS